MDRYSITDLRIDIMRNMDVEKTSVSRRPTRSIPDERMLMTVQIKETYSSTDLLIDLMQNMDISDHVHHGRHLRYTNTSYMSALSYDVRISDIVISSSSSASGSQGPHDDARGKWLLFATNSSTSSSNRFDTEVTVTGDDLYQVKDEITKHVFSLKEEMKQEVSSMSGEVSLLKKEMSGEVSSLKGEVNEMSGQVSSMSGEVSSLKKEMSGEVSSLKGEVNEMSAKLDLISRLLERVLAL
jgi:HAMP domain-containing protein